MANFFAGLAKTRARTTPPTDLESAAAALYRWEENLIKADAGPRAAAEIIRQAQEALSANAGANEVRRAVRDAIADVCAPLESELQTAGASPFIILAAGINGGGKTTTIAKVARLYIAQGKSVLLAAGDTFRAAAREQLRKWAGQLGADFFDGGDAKSPSAVAYDAARIAVARGCDLAIIDTAGRLPAQKNLMEEAAKIRRVTADSYAKAVNERDGKPPLSAAPHETLLVLDATIGQNALAQLAAFDQAMHISGIALAKLDAAAGGGALLAIARDKKNPKPVRFVGVGESAEDLLPFSAKIFADALTMERPA